MKLWSVRRLGESGEITLRGSIVRLWSVRRLKELDRITFRRSAMKRWSVRRLEVFIFKQGGKLPVFFMMKLTHCVL